MWLYQNNPFTENVDNHFGFIYLIENKTNGMKYVGKKLFTKASTRQVKLKKKKIRKQSDWLDYYGSSPRLQLDIEKFGRENFTRTILYMCKTKAECNYRETKEIIDRAAILDKMYYNDWLSCRITRVHMRSVQL